MINLQTTPATSALPATSTMPSTAATAAATTTTTTNTGTSIFPSASTAPASATSASSIASAPSAASVASTSTSAATGTPVRSRSCISCRTRKIRCDRYFPCTNCLRSHAECVYPLGRGRAPKRPSGRNRLLASGSGSGSTGAAAEAAGAEGVGATRSADSEHLAARLARLEAMIRGLRDGSVGGGQEQGHDGIMHGMRHGGRKSADGDQGKKDHEYENEHEHANCEPGLCRIEEQPYGEHKNAWMEPSVGKENSYHGAHGSGHSRKLSTASTGRLMTDDTKSVYVTNMLWASLVNEV